MSEILRVYSDGSGLNSVAALVLQAMGKIHFDVFVFANVGEDSESKTSLAYRREHLEPFAAKHGIKLVETWRTINGVRVTLKEYTLAEDNKSIPIPVVFPGAGYGRRSCTRDWKVRVVQRWIRDHGGAARAIVGIGYTIHEGRRMAKKFPDWHEYEMTLGDDGKWHAGDSLGYSQLYEFPLILQGMSRAKCAEVVAAAGLPPVPRSRCGWCPFKSRNEWIEQKRTNDPEYAESVEMERAVNEKYRRIHANNPKLKKSPWVGLHADGIRLEDVPDQLSLWDEFMDEDQAACGLNECGL